MALSDYEVVRERMAVEGVPPDEFDALYARFRASGFHNFWDWIRVETAELERPGILKRFAERAVEAYTGRSLKAFVLFHLQLGGLSIAALIALAIVSIVWMAVSG